MCEPRRPFETQLPAVGLARRQKLYAWTASDISRQDRTLARSLDHWRKDILGRLSGRNKDKPTKVRIPWIFVGILGLENQFVLLCEDNTICMIDRKEGDRYVPGRVLINGKHVA